MSTVLAIDPGDVASAYTLLDVADCTPIAIGLVPNYELRELLQTSTLAADVVAIEMIASYGMPVGREVFETCVWIGRLFESTLTGTGSSVTPTLIYRRDVKLHLCESARAKDSNVIQALVDRFAPGAPNRGKGTKAAPGWFHGFHDDIWQAYALGVVVADREAGR